MLTVKILYYIVDDVLDVVQMSVECRYKEFKRVFQTGNIQKGEKLVEQIKREALEDCKTAIHEWVAECDAVTVVGQFIPVPANFFTEHE